MSVYVLVHGAWHGSWCWDKVVPLLEKEGHKVQAPDLPGHGNDKTPIPEISLQAYADRVCEILDAQSEPVILAGHSQKGEPPEDTKAPFTFIGILDVTSKEEWMKDVASEKYQKDFFPKFFSNWGADFYAIIGEEVYHGESK